MTQYNVFNVKLSYWHKLKSGIKNDTELTLKIYLNIVGNSNNEDNFLHKLFLTNT